MNEKAVLAMLKAVIASKDVNKSLEHQLNTILTGINTIIVGIENSKEHNDKTSTSVYR